MNHSFRTLFFGILLSAGVPGNAEVTKPCPGGFSGNLLDKFTGSYQSDDEAFRYAAQRRTKARSVVSGNMHLDGQDKAFNLHIDQNVLILELHDGNNTKVFSGDICGRQVEKMIEISLSSYRPKTFDIVEGTHVSFLFSPELNRPHEFSRYSETTNYVTNESFIDPVQTFILK